VINPANRVILFPLFVLKEKGPNQNHMQLKNGQGRQILLNIVFYMLIQTSCWCLKACNNILDSCLFMDNKSSFDRLAVTTFEYLLPSGKAGSTQRLRSEPSSEPQLHIMYRYFQKNVIGDIPIKPNVQLLHHCRPTQAFLVPLISSNSLRPGATSHRPFPPFSLLSAMKPLTWPAPTSITGLSCCMIFKFQAEPCK
jgi:hypothetical protein